MVPHFGSVQNIEISVDLQMAFPPKCPPWVVWREGSGRDASPAA